MFLKGQAYYPVPWSSRWSWSLHLFLGRPMFLLPFGLYCSACFGCLFVSILCTCCSHFSWYCFISFTMFCAQVFCLIHWFFSFNVFSKHWKWLTVSVFVHFIYFMYSKSRFKWPSGLRCGSAAAQLLRLWVRIPPGVWTFVSCECCVLSGRGLCDGPITRPEESYRLWCVVVCGLETSWMRRSWPTGGLSRQKYIIIRIKFWIYCNLPRCYLDKSRVNKLAGLLYVVHHYDQ